MIAPKIPLPEKAFYPIHPDLDSVYYSWRECNWAGINCKYKEVKYLYTDKKIQAWMKANDFGYCKRPSP